mgnify:CR=1 FL=1|jgi:hypothetical protein
MLDPLMILDRAPSPFRRLARRIASGRGLLGKIADRSRFRFSSDQVPSIPTVADSPIRLVIGPANTAGQGFEWARAAERGDHRVAAVALHGVVPDPFTPHVDLAVPMAVFQRSSVWHRGFVEFLLRQTHVIWESGLPLLGRHFGSDPVREIEFFGDHGIKGALMFHGSDIRPPHQHAHQHRWSPFRDPRAPVHLLSDGAEESLKLVRRAGVPVFVSTPDLLEWVPGAIWCPVVVDPARWNVEQASPARRDVPVVVHAPSQKWMKGTDRIEPMLRRLDAEGVIEYRQIVGVPHAQMPALYADADVVLDQFLLGSYGVAACEAMASGRLVVSHVDARTRETVREQTGRELPIVEATVDSLETVLRDVAKNPDDFAHLGQAGPGFVDAVHDGRYSAESMSDFLTISA